MVIGPVLIIFVVMPLGAFGPAPLVPPPANPLTVSACALLVMSPLVAVILLTHRSPVSDAITVCPLFGTVRHAA